MSPRIQLNLTLASLKWLNNEVPSYLAKLPSNLSMVAMKFDWPQIAV